jgi:SnoaL-like protein
MRLLAPDADTTVVTSEDSLLRGLDEIHAFMDRYVAGPTTYSWSWDRRHVSTAGSVGWLLAEGTETAATADRREVHPYRMTMVLERRRDQWLLLQIHGSSPHSS